MATAHGRHNSYTDMSNSTMQGLNHGGSGIPGDGHVSYYSDHSLAISLSLSHLLTHSLTHSLTPSLPHSLTHSLPPSLTPSLPFIIMRNLF